jgi:hypothetical protein
LHEDATDVTLFSWALRKSKMRADPQRCLDVYCQRRDRQEHAANHTAQCMDHTANDADTERRTNALSKLGGPRKGRRAPRHQKYQDSARSRLPSLRKSRNHPKHHNTHQLQPPALVSGILDRLNGLSFCVTYACNRILLGHMSSSGTFVRAIKFEPS